MNDLSILSSIRSAATFIDLAQKLGRVQGYLHPLEGFALHLLAAEGPGTGEIVEIGSFMGLSTCWLASGSRSSGRERVTAVDHFKGSPEHQKGQPHESPVLREEGTTFNRFQGNLREQGLLEHVEPIVDSSAGAARGWSRPVRLVFIDGDHSYDVSKQDFDLWSPHVCPMGLVAFHDIGAWEGVTRFYEDLRRGSQTFREVFAINSLRVMQRVA